MKKPWLAATAAALTALTPLFLPAAADDPPKPLKPVNLDCNTKADEDDPHVSSNGLTLYYSSNAKTKIDLMLSKRSGAQVAGGQAGRWLRPVAAQHKKPATTAASSSPPTAAIRSSSISPPTGMRQSKKGDNFDIYVTYRDGPKQGIRPARGRHGGGHRGGRTAPLADDGRQNAVLQPQDQGRLARLHGDAPSGKAAQGFDEPVLVEELPADFHHATLTPDGKTMYLQGPLDKGRWGLFVSTKRRQEVGQAGAAGGAERPIGPTGDRSPCLSRDGMTLYFASDRDGGKGGLDLYSVPVAD